MALRLGVDLGGTKIEIAVLESDGREMLRRRAPTPRAGYDAALEEFSGLILEAERAAGAPCSVGIGMRKITVREDPVLTARGGAAVPTRITATLVDGQRVSREVDYAPGFAGRPMSRTEVERKFRGNVARRWEPRRIDAILEALWNLERTPELAGLLAMLRVQRS